LLFGVLTAATASHAAVSDFNFFSKAIWGKMFRLKQVVGIVSVISSVAFFSSAHASVLWISDNLGNVGEVDTTTGAVSNVHQTGQVLTDIGFTSNGNLYGTTFTGLYSVSKTTWTATLIGPYGYGGGGMNALVGNGSGLLAASNANSSVYSVNVSNPSAQSVLTTTGTFTSAGDLAFANGKLYESVVNSGSDWLYDVTDHVLIGQFSPSTSTLFGLADDGTTMYAVSGTEVYSVNLSNAKLTALFDYGGHGLGSAYGSAFITEGVPEPSTWAMMILGFLGVGLLAYRRKNGALRLV
jgi:hypothetical protein